MSLRPIATACVLAGTTLLLYGFQLSAAPAGVAETAILQQAQSVTTATPLFFHADADRWLMPVPVYLTATMRAIAPDDIAARLASLAAATIDVVLLFACARLIFTGQSAALLAALLLLLTPAHMAAGRSGSGDLLPLPFALAALLAFFHFLQRDRLRDVAFTGLALGAGIYTQRSAPLTMGFLLVVTIVTLLAGRRRWQALAVVLASFAAALVPAASWFAIHPETYPDTFGRWAIFQAHLRYPLEGVRAFLNWNTLGNRASLYWGFLDPSWLFFGGPLLLATLPLVAIGVAGWRRVWSISAMVMVAGGAIVAPLAGSTFGEARYLADALMFLPFVVLLTTAGAAYCWTNDHARWRWVASILLMTAAADATLQFLRLYGFRT